MANDIGLKILLALREKGWEQKELAKKACVSAGTISYYIANKRSPKFKLLAKIARALGKSLTYFTEEPAESMVASNNSVSFPVLHRAPVFEMVNGELNKWLEGTCDLEECSITEPTNSADPKAFHIFAHGKNMTGRVNEKHSIAEGDLLLVEPNQKLSDGDVCFCFNIDGKMTVERFKRYGNEIYLIPLNEDYRPSTITGRNPHPLHFPITEIKTKLRKYKGI